MINPIRNLINHKGHEHNKEPDQRLQAIRQGQVLPPKNKPQQAKNNNNAQGKNTVAAIVRLLDLFKFFECFGHRASLALKETFYAAR